jgi:hypothetical protein
MTTQHRKPLQFGLKRLFRVVAIVAIAVAVLGRAASFPESLIPVLFPISATAGVLMVLAAVREMLPNAR